MTQSLPSDLKLAFTQLQIQEQVTRLAKEITPWAQSIHQSTQEQVLAICVLRGAVFFFSDLLQKIDTSVEVGFLRAWNYSENETILKKQTHLLVGLEVKNRTILLVDDFCDQARTLIYLKNELLKAGAKEVKTVTLVRRTQEKIKFSPDWVGLEFSQKEWLVGYGLEDNNFYSNLPDIYYKEIS